MDHATHERIAKWERRWLAVTGLMSIVFITLIAYSLATEGTHAARQSGRTHPEALSSSTLFAQPGVTATGPNEYRVTMVGQAFSWTPSTVVLPLGATATFYLTSRDVIHGYQVQSTNINVEVIPSEVAVFQYTFDEPGRFRAACNEYCGSQHHDMVGFVEVLRTSEFANRQQAEAAAAAGPVDGAAAYAANCAGCHQQDAQGIPGAFPPLAGHFGELVTAARQYPLLVVLNGLQGQITVDGVNYAGQMPAFRQLTDDEIAAILNHLAAGFDNPATLPADFAEYTADEVAQARSLEMSAAEVHERRTELSLP